jgi:2'-5' RNA ligase
MSLLNARSGRAPSLWLVPHGAEAHTLTDLISELQEQHGGPTFAPHLTLLGGLRADDLRERTAALASQLSPIEVTLTRASWGGRWFQCVYLLAAPTPGLLSARRMACVALNGDPTAAFLPHVSLLYGDIPADQRAEICRDIPSPVARFIARELVLVDTVGPTEQWTELGRWPLTAPVSPDQ